MPPLDDGKSWRIVKRSQNIDINIIGKGLVGYACRLTDGDVIQFDNHSMTLCFHSYYDNRYDEDENTSKKWPFVALTMVVLLAVMSTIFLFLRKEEKDICETDIIPLQESICQIRVEAVQQILSVVGQKDSIIRSKTIVDNAPTGTAFLTTDGKIITARHCVEYWLGENLDLTTEISRMPEDDVLRWAIETETFNQKHKINGDSIMQMNVYFSIYDSNNSMLKTYASTDSCVHINKDKDGVFLMADFENDYYWRSIRPYFKNRKMAMGDILWIDDATINGQVAIATAEEMSTITMGTKLMICGYPKTESGNKQMIPATGSIKSNLNPNTENLFFESNINHGYSGGPVLMKYRDNIVAIGVVSCVDSISSGLFKWAVPVSVMTNNK